MSDIDRRIVIVEPTLTDPDLTDPDLDLVSTDEDSLVEHMIRRPTEEDFEDVLTPEGNSSGDVVGSGISDATGVSNASLGGTG